MKKKTQFRFDKLLCFAVIFFISVGLLNITLSKAYLSKSNIELESIRKKVNAQEKMNESLSMKINELASIDNIQKVATTYGLEYNNSNIITLTNEE
jgi:cell division protein FtsL